MIQELTRNEFERARPVFSGLQDRVALQALIEGNAPGRLFVDKTNQPTVAFTWTEFRYSYLAGDTSNDAFIEGLRTLLASELVPEARDSHDPTLVLYPYPESWKDKIGSLLPGFSPIELARRTFTFERGRSQVHDWQAGMPQGFRIERVDEQSLASWGQEIAAELEILWRSPGDFLSKGVGYCLLDGDEVVSVCFTAFAGGKKREISVATQPQYRRQGFATLAVSALISHCLKGGLEPVWECWADNDASSALAEKLGFMRKGDHPVYFCEL